MRIIRNFFHNISDIFLAIIIVAVAAGIIYWRLGIILDYPEQLAQQQAVYQQEIAAEKDGDATTDAQAEGSAQEDSEEGSSEESAEGQQ